MQRVLGETQCPNPAVAQPTNVGLMLSLDLNTRIKCPSGLAGLSLSAPNKVVMQDTLWWVLALSQSERGSELGDCSSNRQTFQPSTKESVQHRGRTKSNHYSNKQTLNQQPNFLKQPNNQAKQANVQPDHQRKQTTKQCSSIPTKPRREVHTLQDP